MTAPRNTENIPYGLPGGCDRFSTVKGKTRGEELIALACTALHRKDYLVMRPFGGNGGFGVPEAVQRGRPLFFWWSMQAAFERNRVTVADLTQTH